MSEKRKVTVIPARVPLPELKQVGLYCRESSRRGAQIKSLGAQISGMCNYVIHHGGWVLSGVYIDIHTGTEAEKRDQLQQLIYDCEIGMVNVVVIRTISRLARNTVEALEICRKLSSMGVEVCFKDEGISTNDPGSELILSLMMAVAQEENLNRRMNILWGRQYQVNNRTSELYRKKCYGYRTNVEGALVVSDDEAQVVRQIFQSYIRGNSIQGICNELERNGIPSPRGNANWCKRTIVHILANEKYYGSICLYKTFQTGEVTPKTVINKGQREKVWWVDHHEPIISKELFLQAADERKRRSNVEVDNEGQVRRKSTRYRSERKNVESHSEGILECAD